MAELRERAKLARLAAQLNAQSRYGGRVPPLALLTDDVRLPAPLDAIKALPRGSLVILRAQDRARRVQLVHLCAPICRARFHLMLVADDPELAICCGADGLHLPQARGDALAHWRVRRPGWFISYAAHDLRALHHAAAGGADAALLSPVFATKSHPDTRSLGPFRLAALLRAARLPVYGLGGINAQSCLRVRGLPLAGAAAIGALAV